MAKRRVVKATKPGVEYVEWDDAVADIGWERRSDVALAAQKCASIGRVVREDDHTLVIAGTWGIGAETDEDTNCRIAIPKGWISRRVALKDL